MGLIGVLGIDEDIMKVNNDKNIVLLDQDNINIFLGADQCVGKPKKYYLVLEVTI